MGDARGEKKFGRSGRVILDDSLRNSQRIIKAPGKLNNRPVHTVLREGSYALPAVKLRVKRQER
jgi:hypothetical protein